MEFYEFVGEWKVEEERIVRVEIDKHVVPTNNFWLFSHAGSDYFDARRDSWNMGSLWATTAAGLAQKLAEYYAK